MNSKRMNPTGLSVNEPCRGDVVHTIRFNEKGQLSLLHHDQTRERAFEDLGGEPCWCRRQLQHWKERLTLPRTVFPFFRDSVPVPAEFEPYLADCNLEQERRAQRRTADAYRDEWNQNVPINKRPAFLQRLLNRLLCTRLGLPDRQWLSLKYTPSGWFPATLHYPYPGDGVRNIFPLGVRSDYVAQIYEPGLAISNGGLTLFVPGGDNPTVARQLVPQIHPVTGVCLRRRLTWLVSQAMSPPAPDVSASPGTSVEPWPVDFS
ncbi:MAG: hypothetical protein JNM56_15125 [Planctomycetia bacterium]|nr:hypothetical protein [Planctomycetia bacterium]